MLFSLLNLLVPVSQAYLLNLVRVSQTYLLNLLLPVSPAYLLNLVRISQNYLLNLLLPVSPAYLLYLSLPFSQPSTSQSNVPSQSTINQSNCINDVAVDVESDKCGMVWCDTRRKVCFYLLTQRIGKLIMI